MRDLTQFIGPLAGSYQLPHSNSLQALDDEIKRLRSSQRVQTCDAKLLVLVAAHGGYER
jgi:hypothetical protein